MWISCIFCSIRTLALANFLECLTSFPFGTDHQLMWFLSFSQVFCFFARISTGYTYDNVNHVPRFSHGPWLCLIFLFSIEICITDSADSCNRDAKSFRLSCFATIFHKILIRIFLVKNKTTCTHRILCSFLLIEESFLLLSHVQCFLCGKTQMSMHAES